MLRLGVFGGKYMTDCRARVPGGLVRAREAVRRAPRSRAELFRRQRVAVARGVAPEQLAAAAGSARLVPVVLPLLHGPPRPGRRAADRAMAGDRAARGARSASTASPATATAVRASARRCSTGPTTAGRSSFRAPVLLTGHRDTETRSPNASPAALRRHARAEERRERKRCRNRRLRSRRSSRRAAGRQGGDATRWDLQRARRSRCLDSAVEKPLCLCELCGSSFATASCANDPSARR